MTSSRRFERCFVTVIMVRLIVIIAQFCDFDKTVTQQCRLDWHQKKEKAPKGPSTALGIFTPTRIPILPVAAALTLAPVLPGLRITTVKRVNLDLRSDYHQVSNLSIIHPATQILQVSLEAGLGLFSVQCGQPLLVAIPHAASPHPIPWL